MKFTYAYKTSDGKRHEAATEAPSREAVFEALRAQGIKAIKVVAADGSKANGAPRTTRPAVAIALFAFIVVALVGGGSWWLAGGGRARRTTLPDGSGDLLSPTRRQIIGDAFAVEKGVRTGWSDVFAHEGERFLASFAIPGVQAAQRTSTEDELRAALERKIAPEPSDSLEVRQIKAMVEGMKDELRRFVAAGGTIAAYGRRLVERQEEELRYYNLVKSELDAAATAKKPQAELLDLWERRNEDLRQMGIRLVPMPE